MKKIILAFLLMYGVTFAQCEQMATGFGNQTVPSYEVKGDVNVTYNASTNKVSIHTGANFSTASGPDVKVFLVNSEGKTKQQLQESNISNLINIPFLSENTGDTIEFSGAQTLTVDVPIGIDLKDYDTVFFYCFQFGAFWDYGSIVPIDTNACQNLSFSSLEKTNEFDVFPIPTNSVLNIKGDIRKITDYKLYNFKGQLINEADKISSVLDLSKYPKGIYSLVLFSKEGFEVEKIILN